MKQILRIVLMTMLLAALPLRGYAGVVMGLCEGHHGGAVAAQEHAQEHGDSHHHDSDEDPGAASHAASVCSVCASCCAGASLAPDPARVAEFQSPGSGRIDYLDHRPSGFVPAHLDRPPLTS